MKDCEEKLSVCEKYAAERVIKPILLEKANNVEYSDLLLKFAVSLSWRVLKLHEGEALSNFPHYAAEISKVLSEWRKFLLGNTETPGPNSHHLFVIATTPGQAFEDASNEFRWYNWRAVDGDVYEDDQHCLQVIVKLPGLVFVSWVSPCEVVERGWSDHKLISAGTVPSIFKIPGELKEYLTQRGEQAIISLKMP